MPRAGSVYSAPAGTEATASTTIESAKYNAFVNDVVDTLGNEVRPVAVGGTGVSSYSALRTAMGLVVGTDVQAYDAGLASIAGLTTAANKMIYTDGSDSYAVTDLTAFARSILDDANEAAFKATVNLEIGTDVQAYNANLASLSGITLQAGDVLYATGANTLARLGIGTAGQVLKTNSGATAPEWAADAGQWTDISAVSLAGSSTVNIATGLASGIDQIELLLSVVDVGVGATTILVQLSTGASFATSGYESNNGNVASGGGVTFLASTSGFLFNPLSVSNTLNGKLSLQRIPGTNRWMASASGNPNATNTQFGHGSITLGGALDGIRVTSGANFDGGSVSGRYL